jgi:DNA-binding NarL/FixJ family response regulator
MRIVIADDEVLVRDGLARLLEDAGVEVVSRCMDAATLLRTVDSWQPDVAIALLGLLSASQLTREGPSRSGGPCTLDRTSPSHPRAKVAVVDRPASFRSA